MSTAGAARKRTTTHGSPASELPQWFVQQCPSWTPVAVHVDARISKICTATEERIVRAIISATVGDYRNGRKEWAPVSQATFSARVHACQEQIRKSLRTLEEKQLIQSRTLGPGKGFEYRICYANFATAPELDRRTVQRDPEKKTPRTRSDLNGKPLRICLDRESPPRTLRFRVKGGKLPGADLATFQNAGLLDLCLNLNGHPPTGVVPPNEGATGVVPPNGGPTGVGGSPEFRQAVNAEFRRLFDRDIDDILLARVANELGATPLYYLLRVIRSRTRRPERIEPGLFPVMARDARNTWVADQARISAQDEAPPRLTAEQITQLRAYLAEPDLPENQRAAFQALLESALDHTKEPSEVQP